MKSAGGRRTTRARPEAACPKRSEGTGRGRGRSRTLEGPGRRRYTSDQGRLTQRHHCEPGPRAKARRTEARRPRSGHSRREAPQAEKAGGAAVSHEKREIRALPVSQEKHTAPSFGWDRRAAPLEQAAARSVGLNPTRRRQPSEREGTIDARRGRDPGAARGSMQSTKARSADSFAETPRPAFESESTPQQPNTKVRPKSRFAFRRSA